MKSATFLISFLSKRSVIIPSSQSDSYHTRLLWNTNSNHGLQQLCFFDHLDRPPLVHCLARCHGVRLFLDHPPSKSLETQLPLQAVDYKSKRSSNYHQFPFQKLFSIAIRSNYARTDQDHQQILGETHHLAQRSWIRHHQGTIFFPCSLFAVLAVTMITLWAVN